MIDMPEFMLPPKPDFEHLAAQARKQADQERQDAGDANESRRRMRESGGTTLPQLRAKLGLSGP